MSLVKKSRRFLITFTLFAVAYWTFFFGAAFYRTVELYQRGSSIHNELFNITRDAHANGTLHPTNVPLILHRMWKNDHFIGTDDRELPSNWTRAFDSCTDLYSRRNWTTILWTDDSTRSFMENYYPHFLPTYDSYRCNIQRVDAARYFILYHFGGVYMDMDVGCVQDKDLGDLVYAMDQMEKAAVLPQTRPLGFSNDVMISTRKSTFFKTLITALPGNNRWYGLPYLTVMYSTGPMFLSLQYMRLTSAMQKDILTLPPELYTNRRTRYFKHLRGSTWHQHDAHLIQWMMGHKFRMVGALLLGLVVRCKLRATPTKQEGKEV